ncbi:HD domain-containing phosphohydrolase [Chitinimonas sp.]|uniref:HD domain-containing phosphohydrolase n=1 Tax=Chitinimonas sp. TaxID=1934313 RepID=UPI0035B0B0D3
MANGMQIVVVDDNAVNRLMFARLIKNAVGVEPTLFESAWEGLDWCLHTNPDLILLDYMMPELDGIGFLTAFRSDERGQKSMILMITADHDSQVRLRALELGANDFLTKPVEAAELRARARNMLAIREGQAALEDRAKWLQEEVAKATADLRAREQESVFLLTRAAEFRDPETGAHILRMAHYSTLIARRLGLEESRLELLLQAAPMHDIGKLGIPDHILLKPGKHTPEEWEIMRRHAEIGYRLLSDGKSALMQLGALIAWTHHEKFDGSGYPRGLAGEDIPIEGRIVAVADVYDALTSVRPYKPAWTVDAACALLREQSGAHFDPAAVAAFFSNFDEVLEIQHRYADEVPGTT